MSPLFQLRRHLRPGEKVLLSRSADRVGPNAAHPSIDTRVLATIHSTEGRGGVTVVRMTLDEYGERAKRGAARAPPPAMEKGCQRKYAAIVKAIAEMYQR